MAATPYHDAARLNKLESLAVLEGGYRHDSTSDVKFGNGLPGHHANVDDDDELREPPLSLDISLRRGRLILITVLAVAGITTITVVGNIGFEVGHFNADDKNETQREQLLDDYNSYSANVASAFGKPVESFITIAVQIIVLRFMVASMTKPELGWKVGAVTVALSAGIGYLINNGFNAVNVQLRSSSIDLVISASDLSTQATDNSSFSDTAESMRTTTESVAKNPITNTILRNLVRTREPKAPSRCNMFYGQTSNLDGGVPDTTLDFDLAQRDWQSRLLEEALEPKQLRLVANATDKNANKNVKAADLPMNASLAADLFVYALETGRNRMNWAFARADAAYASDTEVGKRYAENARDPMAKMAGILPTGNEPVSETEQREWFLRELLTRLPKGISNVTAITSDIAVEFSHVDVSPMIQFDAITIEIEVDPVKLSNVTTSGRKLKLSQTMECGPWPALCMIKKARLTSGYYDIAYDTRTQIFAVGTCANSNGEEALTSQWIGTRMSLECDYASNSSMIVGSIGKRLVADSIQQNATFDATGTRRESGSAVVKNLRKIYSFTVGRLSWKTVDLGAEFGASCGADATSCMGIQIPLSPALKATAGADQTKQLLIAGAKTLPAGRLPLMYDSIAWPFFRTQPIVELKELARMPQSESYTEFTAAAGDPLFLHNVKAVEWDGTVFPVMNNSAFIDEVTPDTCRVQIEDRLYLAIKNHMYMEYSLQPAYTAATFYLLQNAVVKDTIKVKDNSLSLDFDKNVEKLALFVSIPDRNAWLTYAGCIALVACIGYVLVLSSCKRNSSRGASLGEIKEPHVIARVMLDEALYPPAVLHRRVVREADAAKNPRQLDEFVINGISLQALDELDRMNGVTK